MAILLGTPTSTAVVTQAASEWRSTQPKLTGWDGSEFDLSSVAGGVLLMRGGFRGWNMPPIERRSTVSPSVAGSRWRGYRVAEREVFLPLYVFHHGGSQAWTELDSALWRIFNPGKTLTLSFTRADGSTRTLRCRYADDGDPSYDMAPSQVGWMRYGVTCVAEDPFWKGEQEPRTFFDGADDDFYNSGAAPPYRISPANKMATANIDNAGDEPAWPVWTVRGPFTTVSVGIGNRLVTVTANVAAGQSRTIDTSPAAQFLVDQAGVERNGELTAINFAPVPAGTSVPLSVSMVGTGSVDVSLQPLFWRAW